MSLSWIVSLGIGLWATVSTWLWLRAAKKRDTANRTIGELAAVIKLIESERDDDRDRNRRTLRATTQHVVSCQAQLKDEIKAADRRGDGASVLRLVNTSLERVRKLSEADRSDKNGELHRRALTPTSPAETKGD